MMPVLPCVRPAIAIGCCLLAATAARAQPTSSWAIEERATRDCVEEVSLQFDSPGAQGGHAPRTLCGSSGLRLFDDGWPSGAMTVRWKDGRHEVHSYQLPLATMLRRDDLKLPGSVLELVFGADTFEVWVRPLAAGDEPPGRPGRQRIFFGGVETAPAAPLRPGIHATREPAAR